MEFISQVVNQIFSFHTILLIIFGCLFGIILGAVPGLNGGIGVSLMLPFTFGMMPINGLLLLGGIYMGGTYGGSISAILLNVPGSAEAFCTGLEGNPLAKKGRGREALYLAALSSVTGGVIGVGALVFFAPPLAKAALKFGPPEMFLVALMGLTVVGSLTGKNIFKGFFAAVFGIYLGMIGIDNVSGAYRLNFGFPGMNMGIQLIPVLLGLFSIAEMMMQIETMVKNKKSGMGKQNEIGTLGEIKALTVFKKILAKPALVIKSSLIGTIIGILPGTGSAIASFVAYGEAKRSAKEEEEKFGHGNPKGIIAAESSNNAAVGGALVPMLSLGIPGSPTAAVMYGAMVIHGLAAGPRLFIDNALFSYSFVYGMMMTVVIMGIVGVFCVPFFSKILKVEMKYIIPVVIICSLIGSFSIRNSIFDVIVTIVFGFIGLLFNRSQIPTAPIVLGLILSQLIESNFRLSMTIAGATETPVMQYILTRPLSIIIILIGLFLIYANFKSMKIESKTLKN
jgi:putative tricarboxylic transport membrane protein